MPVGFTFGSVGDIISLCIVIRDAVKALDESRGSSTQYQEIVRELWALDRVLLEVELLWRTCEESVELNALRVTSRRVVDQCHDSIEKFLKTIQNYGPSLRKGGSKNSLRDAARKLGWQMLRSEEVEKFRAEINAHCSALGMLLITASVNQARLHDKRLHARFDHSIASAENQEKILKEVKTRLGDVQKQTERWSSNSTKIVEALRLDWVRQLGRELKTFLQKIFVTNIAIYRAVVDIRGQLPGHLERCLYQEPFILEDSIGRIAPVHMQFISSWHTFDAVLELRFQGVPGYKMVQEKRYVIQESANKKEIDRSRVWEASFLPGQKIVMSMLFDVNAPSTTSCPRCQKSTEEPPSAEIKCDACGMWYRRITEYNDVDAPDPLSLMRSQKSQPPQPSFGQTSFKLAVYGPEEFQTASRKRKRKEPDTDVTQFKRARLRYRKTRIREAKPVETPFSRYADSTYLFATKRKIYVGSETPGATQCGMKLYDNRDSLPTGETLISQRPSTRKLLPVSVQVSTDAVRRNEEFAWKENESLSSEDEKLSSEGEKEDAPDAAANNIKAFSRIFKPSDGTSFSDRDGAFAGISPWDSGDENMAWQSSSIPDDCSHAHLSSGLAVLDNNTHLDRVYAKIGFDPESPWFPNEKGMLSLFLAAMEGDIPGIKRAIADGADIKHSDSLWQNALQAAAQGGHFGAVKVLVKEAPEFSASMREAETAVRHAARSGHIEVVRFLLHHELEYAGFDRLGMTPLHLAASKGRFEAVLLMIKHGETLSIKDNFGRTPSEIALAHGHGDVVQALESAIAKSLSQGSEDLEPDDEKW